MEEIQPYLDKVAERQRLLEDQRLKDSFPIQDAFDEGAVWDEEFKKLWFTYRGERLDPPPKEREDPDMDSEEERDEEFLARHNEVIELYMADHPDQSIQPPEKKKLSKSKKKRKIRYLTLERYRELEKKGKLAAQLRGKSLELSGDEYEPTEADRHALIIGGGRDKEEETEDWITDKTPGGSLIGGKIKDLLSRFSRALTPDSHIGPVINEFVQRVPWFQLDQYKKNLQIPMTKMVKAYLEGNPAGLKMLPFTIMDEAVKARDARRLKGMDYEVRITSSSDVKLVWADSHEDGTPMLGFRIELMIENKIPEDDDENIYVEAGAEQLKMVEAMLIVTATEEKGLKFAEEWLPAGEKVFQVKVEEEEKQRAPATPEHIESFLPGEEARAEDIIKARQKARADRKDQEGRA